MIENLARQRPFWIALLAGGMVGLSTYAIFSSGLLALSVASLGAGGFLLGEATTRLLAGINAQARRGWVTGLIVGAAYVLIERLPENPTANIALAALFIILPVVLRRWVSIKTIARLARWVAPRSRDALGEAIRRFRWDEEDEL
ncbi:MAG: hypothetical protein PVF49_08285 [Anaerolineales bacterium]|jgi:hypothetical protein